MASDCDMFMHVCMYQCFMVYGRMVNQWFMVDSSMVYKRIDYGLLFLVVWFMVVCSIRHRATSQHEGERTTATLSPVPAPSEFSHGRPFLEEVALARGGAAAGHASILRAPSATSEVDNLFESAEICRT